MLDTLPIRTMVCKCITGYQGNAAIECTPVPTCPPGRGLVLNEFDECVCPAGYYLDDEGVCVRCRTELGFVLIGGRCICDSSRGLVPSSDGSTCICPPGMELNPEGSYKCTFNLSNVFRLTFLRLFYFYQTNFYPASYSQQQCI